MAIHERNLTEKEVHQLFELACSPFILKEFRKRWESYGWVYTPSCPDDIQVQGETVEGWPFLVDQLNDKVHCAIVPICLWTTWDPQCHPTAVNYQQERETFDEIFESAFRVSENALSPPFLKWTDQNENAHRAVAWEGTHGILILQQAARDLIDGVEVDFWIEGCSRQDFRPNSSMLGWLEQRSLELHAEYGYGPPIWD